FTALLHHVYRLATLGAAYCRLKRGAAPGVDGGTWQRYEENLETNLQDLATRLKRGAYRGVGDDSGKTVSDLKEAKPERISHDCGLGTVYNFRHIHSKLSSLQHTS